MEIQQIYYTLKSLLLGNRRPNGPPATPNTPAINNNVIICYSNCLLMISVIITHVPGTGID